METLRARLEAPPELPRLQRTLAGPHPLNGATVANLSSDIIDLAGANPLNVVEGVLVVDAGQGFAARAGFRRGDLVREINGRTVATVGELEAALATPGGWRVTVRRGGREMTADFQA